MNEWACERALVRCLACHRDTWIVPVAYAVKPGAVLQLEEIGLIYRTPDSCAMAEETLAVTRELEATGQIIWAPGFCTGPWTVLEVHEQRRVGPGLEKRARSLQPVA